ncbi:hypothetical protein N781_00630 [Pontibacillus halophilus JSM 076056 = DSM 19796]|uniref:Uncharacterized protein n=1 Tax=Pontibacillus halophilus JSM 076056 = DSM 19796 TaxID=1385510 RepID=A0A0A5GSE3_9BACI|nr:hypothetical protein [Pontibacillus halophilus]KGX94055.1 hypothetical protein N781_00630 [Pontibacillus halophilus JSM 076056 = DSM 19796]
MTKRHYEQLNQETLIHILEQVKQQGEGSDQRDIQTVIQDLSKKLAQSVS